MKKLTAAAALVFAVFGTSTAHASTAHTVQRNEVLWQVGAKYQMPYPVIQRTNGFSSNTIYTGQTLRIPEKYWVKSGDTLWNISQRYGLSVNSIRNVNNEWDSSLHVGQVLYLPTPVRTSTSTVTSLSSADRDLFERLVSAEAKGESFKGQVAVANVVLNRVKSPDFPNTVRGVIMQYYGNIPAFSPVDDGRIYQPATQSAKDAVRAALNGTNYVGGALFFYNPNMTSQTNWIRQRTVTSVIGDHYFAK